MKYLQFILIIILFTNRSNAQVKISFSKKEWKNATHQVGLPSTTFRVIKCYILEPYIGNYGEYSYKFIDDSQNIIAFNTKEGTIVHKFYDNIKKQFIFDIINKSEINTGNYNIIRTIEQIYLDGGKIASLIRLKSNSYYPFTQYCIIAKFKESNDNVRCYLQDNKDRPSRYKISEIKHYKQISFLNLQSIVMHYYNNEDDYFNFFHKKQ